MLVDNSPHAYGYDLNNGIPIETGMEMENQIKFRESLTAGRRLQFLL